MQRLAPLAVAALAALAAAFTLDGGFTDAALEVARGAGRVSDGAAVWSDWLPLASSLPAEPGAAHTRSLLLWVACALAVFALARRLGLSWGGATVAAGVFATHPIALAAHGDVAAQGLLWATLGLVGGVAAGLPVMGPYRRRPELIGAAALAGGCVALGTLAHPAVALAPLVTGLLAWSLWRSEAQRWERSFFLRRAWPPLASQIAAAALVLALRAALGPASEPEPETNIAVGADGAIGLGAAGHLVIRALTQTLSSIPLVRQPWDVDWGSVSGSDPLAILGVALLVALPIGARLVRRAPLSAALWWVWAMLLFASQLAEPLPSAQAPALSVWLLVAPALALGVLVRGTVPTGIGLALCTALALLPTRMAAPWVADEESWSAAEIEALPDSPEPRIRVGRQRLEEGRPRAALAALEGSHPALALWRGRAHLMVKRLSQARRELRAAPGLDAEKLGCELRVEERDAAALRVCRAAYEQAPRDPWVIAAYARSLRQANRVAEAESLLRGALADAPRSRVLIGALARLMEQVGWMREAVEVWEHRLEVHPDDPHSRRGLVAALERKARGDILAKRYPEAIAALERALEVEPGAPGLHPLLHEAREGAAER